MSIDDAIARAFVHWRSQGIPMLPGAGRDSLETVWRGLNRTLSADVVALYRTINGFEYGHMDDNHWTLWSLERIVEENQQLRSDGVVFGDLLILSYGYEFRREDSTRSSVWINDFNGSTELAAPSVADFLRRCVVDPRSLSM